MDACLECGKERPPLNKAYCSIGCRLSAQTGSKKAVEPKEVAMPLSRSQVLQKGLAEAKKRGWDVASFLNGLDTFIGGVWTH